MISRATDATSAATSRRAAPRPADEQRPLDAHERGKRCLLAMRAFGDGVRKLVFYLRCERTAPSPASAFALSTSL